MDLFLVGNAILRQAIQQNLVSFPSQIPSFTERGGTHERMAQLYFVRGWPMKDIGQRYGLTKSGVRKLLSDWRTRAVAAGYIQDIQPELLAVLSSEPSASEFTEPERAWEMPLPAEPWGALSTAIHL